MAGSYSDAPSRRMAIDDDGTVGLSQVVLDGIRQSVVDVSAANKENLNDEEAGDVLTTGGGSNDMKLIWIFPELREFDGYFARGKDAGDPFDGEYSGNTTNGWDGTWTEFRASASEGTLVVIPDYRDDITSQENYFLPIISDCKSAVSFLPLGLGLDVALVVFFAGALALGAALGLAAVLVLLLTAIFRLRCFFWWAKHRVT